MNIKEAIDTLIGRAWRGDAGPKLDAAIDAVLDVVTPRICPDCGGSAIRREIDGVVDAKCKDCGVVVGWDQCRKRSKGKVEVVEREG